MLTLLLALTLATDTGHVADQCYLEGLSSAKCAQLAVCDRVGVEETKCWTVDRTIARLEASKVDTCVGMGRHAREAFMSGQMLVDDTSAYAKVQAERFNARKTFVAAHTLRQSGYIILLPPFFMLEKGATTRTTSNILAHETYHLVWGDDPNVDGPTADREGSPAWNTGDRCN